LPIAGGRGRTRIAYNLWWIYGAIPTAIAFLGVRAPGINRTRCGVATGRCAKVGRLEDAEDVRLKNEVTYWFAVRDSWMRRVLLAIVLWGFRNAAAGISGPTESSRVSTRFLRAHSQARRETRHAFHE